MIHGIRKGDADDPDHMRAMMGPGMVDNQLRQAIQCLWMTLPENKRSLDAVEQETRRLIDRIFRDFHEDEKRLGKP